MFRVTNTTIQQNWISSLQKRLNDLDGLNRKIGSGIAVEKPEDDPTGANRIVQIEELTARNEQYLKNIDEAIAFNSTTEITLDQVYDRLVRVKSLAVEAANDPSVSTSAAFEALAAEIEGIRENILQLARTKTEDKYLFSGTAGDVPPYEEDGGVYLGNSEVLNGNVGNGQVVSLNLPGDLVFREPDARSAYPVFAQSPSTTLPAAAGSLVFTVYDGKTSSTVTLADGVTDAVYATPQEVADAINAQLDPEINVVADVIDDRLRIKIRDSEAGGEITIGGDTASARTLDEAFGITYGTRNVFGFLDELASLVRSRDPGTVGDQLDRLDRMMNTVNTERGRYGTRARNLEFARSRLEAANVDGQALRERIEGIDLPESVMKLSAQEQAYETSLAAAARIFNISILNFLR